MEKIFNYNGMGQPMLFAAQRKDIPMLTAGRHRHRLVYMLATLIADLIIAWMNPRIRLKPDADGRLGHERTRRPGARGAAGAASGTCPGTNGRRIKLPAPPTGLRA